MPDPNKEFPYILSRTRQELTQQRFPFVDPAVVSKYFPSEQDRYRDPDKFQTFDVDLQKMKTEDPELYRNVAGFLRSNCDMLFNAYCSDEDVSNSNGLIDYAMMVSKTSDIGKYFRG